MFPNLVITPSNLIAYLSLSCISCIALRLEETVSPYIINHNLDVHDFKDLRECSPDISTFFFIGIMDLQGFDMALIVLVYLHTHLPDDCFWSILSSLSESHKVALFSFLSSLKQCPGKDFGGRDL